MMNVLLARYECTVYGIKYCAIGNDNKYVISNDYVGKFYSILHFNTIFDKWHKVLILQACVINQRIDLIIADVPTASPLDPTKPFHAGPGASSMRRSSSPLQVNSRSGRFCYSGLHNIISRIFLPTFLTIGALVSK